MSRRSLRAALATATVMLGTVLAAPAAQAADAPPQTTDDTVTLDAGDLKVVDVLANDTDPDANDLAVCRVTLPSGSPLSVQIQSGGIAVSSPITTSGTFTLTYYACDYNSLTAATLTVNVTKVPAVTARKVASRPGHVQFINPGDQAVKVMYTVPSGDGPEGRVSVPAGGSAIVTVTKHRIIYVAVRKSGAIVGYGTVRDI